MGRRLVNEEPEGAPKVNIRFDTVNEQVVLAVALMHPTIRHGLVRRFRDSVPFVERTHVALWEVVVAMAGDNLEFDPATVQSYGDDELADYAAQLVSLRPDVPPNLEHHIRALEWSMQRYQAVNGPLAELILQLRDPHTPKEAVVESARRLSTAFTNGQSGVIYDTSAVITEQMGDLHKRAKGRAIYPYGIDGLDVDSETNDPRIIPGAAPKRITLITGVSGSGKSTVTDRIILGQLDQDRKVCIGAWEMNPGVTLEVLATMRCGLSRTDVTTGNLKPEDLRLLRNAMEEFRERIKFIKLPNLTGLKRNNLHQVDSMIDAVEESGAEVFVADLLRKGFLSHDPEAEELALNHIQERIENSDVHALVVQQQRMKDIEMRQDKRPTREGVKGTSAWVEIADTVLGVHRDAQWKNVEDSSLEIDILKQRYGVWPLAVRFKWNPAYATLSDGVSVPYDIALSQEVNMGGAVAKVFARRKR